MKERVKKLNQLFKSTQMHAKIYLLGILFVIFVSNSACGILNIGPDNNINYFGTDLNVIKKMYVRTFPTKFVSTFPL